MIILVNSCSNYGEELILNYKEIINNNTNLFIIFIRLYVFLIEINKK